MKTKREWIASAVLLLGSGSILSAAALATTPSSQKSATPKVTPAAFAAALAVDAPSRASAEAAQSAEVESAVQVVTGDLQKDELYIFAENESVPEKVINENPDAAIAVLGANEKKAAEKIELFTKTVKVVAERREKARIVAAVKAEADDQRIRDWNGGHVRLAYDRKISTEKSLLPIQNHLYPYQKQLVNIPAITLSAADADKVYQAMQRVNELEQVEVNQPGNYLDKLTQLEKITFPVYHGVRHRAAQFAEMISSKIRSLNTEVHLDAIVKNEPRQVAAVTHSQPKVETVANMNAKLVLPIRALHRYSLHLPEYLSMQTKLPSIAQVISHAPAQVASAKTEVKPIAKATAAVLAHGKLVFPERTLHRYVFLLPKRMQMTAMMVPAQEANAMKDERSAAVHSAVNSKSAAIVQAAVTAKAEVAAPAIHAHVGVVGSAFSGVNIAKNTHRLHRPSWRLSDKLNVALLVPSIYSMKVTRATEASAQQIKLAEKHSDAVSVAVTSKSAKKVAAAVSDKSVAINKVSSAKVIVATAKPHTTIAIALSVGKNPQVHHASAAKVMQLASVDKPIARHKNQASTKAKYVTPAVVVVKPRVSLNHPKPKHHIDVAARERALTALEKQLASEPAPIFQPQVVATRRIEEPRAVVRSERRQSPIIETRPVYQPRVASATDQDEPVRQRHYKVRPAEANVASLDGFDGVETTRQATKRYRKWSRPEGFSQMMME